MSKSTQAFARAPSEYRHRAGSSRLLWLAAALGLASCAAPAQDSPASALRSLGRAPHAAGELVYRGAVYDPSRGPNSAAVFNYERRVTPQGDALISTHVSLDEDGTLAVVDAATHDSAYRLRTFDSLQAQTGTVGRVTVDADGDVHFDVTRARRRRTRTERATDPVVVGPTLFGYALAHWEALVSGEALKVRFAVVERAQTYGFTLRKVHADAHTTTIAMRATGLLTRASVPTMHLVFDTQTRDIVRYQGRVPPVVFKDGKARALDARVEYAFVADGYR